MLRALPLLVAASLVLPASATAAITPTRDAGALAGSLTSASSSGAIAASALTTTPGGNPVAVSTTALGGFPLIGPSYAILTSGDSRLASDPQTNFAGVANGGDATPERGSAEDVSILRIDVDVPAPANCLRIGFRFLSEEYPTFVGGSVNDGFIAQLDTNAWSGSGNGITATDNFAFDEAGRVISVNSMPVGEDREALPEVTQQAAGTIYDGATRRLSAARPTTPGRHSLYLSLFDQGDQDYDSAVFVDALELEQRPADECVPGAREAQPPLPPPPPPPIEPEPQVLGTQAESPEPVLGETVVAAKVRGTVRIKGADGRFRELGADEAIPLGSTVDATKGTVRLTAAAAPGGATQTADFYQGQFKVTQSRGSKPVTELALTAKLRCPARGRASQSARRRVRRLWGDGKGRFRTRGRHGAATVRGTKWLTEDRCDGTLVRVKRGRVTVRDFARRKSVTVKRGKSYLARAKRRG